MSAPSADSATEDAGAEKLVQLFDNINEAKTEESKKPGAFTYLIRNPLMAGGMAATAVFMFKGIRAASAGESRTLTEMLQKRVAGQFGTLVVIMTSFAYFMSTTPEKKEEAEAQAHAMHQRALDNYHQAQQKK